MKRILLKCSLWLLPLFMLSCAKDIIDTTGGLMGVISDSRSGQFLSGVSVVLSPTGKTYTTGADGKYEFQNVEAQEYSVTASKLGYLSDKKTVTVQAGNTANLDFQLTMQGLMVSVSPEELDFGATTTSMVLNITHNGTGN